MGSSCRAAAEEVRGRPSPPSSTVPGCDDAAPPGDAVANDTLGETEELAEVAKGGLNLAGMAKPRMGDAATSFVVQSASASSLSLLAWRLIRAWSRSGSISSRGPPAMGFPSCQSLSVQTKFL